MNALGNFTPIGEVSADDRARVPVGKAGVRRDDRYAVAVNDDGEILLTPLVSIPKRELLVWEDSQVREALSRSLLQSAEGKVKRRGSFSQYAEPTEEDPATGAEQ
jgi:hypothetical protein